MMTLNNSEWLWTESDYLWDEYTDNYMVHDFTRL